MTQKQREDHIQAKYWNGFITRTEAQKVFDEMSQVIQAQAGAMAKFDAAISCIAEKVGVKPEDVNNWITAKVEEANKQAEEAKGRNDASADQGKDVPSLVTAG